MTSDVGISIEGIGITLESGNKGTIWGWSGSPPADLEGYTWQDGLVEPPSAGKDESDPRTGTMILGGYTAKLHARPSIRRRLLARQDLPEYGLLADITAGATSISIGVSGLTGVVYIGEETIWLKTDSGGGTYEVERGFWGSPASAHPAGSGVFTRPPYYRNRLVTFWVHNGQTMTRRGRCYLADLDTERGQTVIVLQCEGPLAGMQGVTRLRNSPRLPVDVECVTVQDNGVPTLRVTWDSDGFESIVAKPFNSAGDPQSDWYWRRGGNLLTDPFAFAQIDGAIDFLFDGARYNGPLGAFPGVIIGNKFASSSEGPVGDPVYELAVWHRGLGRAPYPISEAESVFTNPWQPLAICGALLCSGDGDTIVPGKLDFLNGQLGMGIGWLIGERGIQAFIELAEEDQDVSIDQLYLGWDGRPVDVLQVVMEIMIAHGYWLAPDVEGFLIPRRFDPLTVKTLAEAVENEVELLYDLDSPPLVSQKPGYGRILQRYTALVGRTPVFEGTNVQGNAIGATSRIDKMIDPQENDLDFSTWSIERRQGVISFIARQAAFLSANMPTVRISANDWRLEGLDYAIGQWATLRVPSGSDDILFDDAGEGVGSAQLQTSPFAMMITGRGWNTETDAYELDGLLVNHTRPPGRFIAPEGVLAGTGAEASILLFIENDEEGQPGDALSFTEGQQVRLYDENLAPKDIFRTVIAVSAGSVTVNAAFSATVQAGDILRLADFDDYTFADFGNFRGYAYLADANDTLGTANERADEWQ